MGSIRLLLARAVVFSHATACGISMVPGHVAVQAFFIVSGFYMSLILNEKHKNRSALVFDSNRFLRFFPTHVVVVGFAFFVPMPFIFDLTKNNRADKFLGNLSYSRSIWSIGEGNRSSLSG